jgi:hypothetical protein
MPRFQLLIGIMKMTYVKHISSSVCALMLAGAALSVQAGSFHGSASWGETSASVQADGRTIYGGYIRDKDATNGNCVKLKQGQYTQVANTRTCSGHPHWFDTTLPDYYGSVYLYEENTNRTAGMSFY